METAIYITIGTSIFCVLINTINAIWGIYDNKRRERESLENPA